MKRKQTLLSLVALIIAGEAIFFLPFVIARIFRPTLLAVFEINNFQLGLWFSTYGIVAMASYFLGGPLADKFPARNLMASALAVTALGGFYMATIPDPSAMTWLFGFWGLSTIFLFWAALIKATRQWGGTLSQGKAFGFLDGGRGLSAAIIGTVGIALFSQMLPAGGVSLDSETRKSIFQNMILVFSFTTLAIAILVWFFVPKSGTQERTSQTKFSLERIKEIAKLPSVWLQAIIVLCAYVGYKVTDDFSLLAHDVLGYDDVDSATVGTFALWLRPIGAVAAGLLADRFKGAAMLIWGFALMMMGALAVAVCSSASAVAAMLVVSITAVCLGVYGLRGLYFAVMGEGKIPLALTGTAVGLVSFVGYTPDIFMGPLMGLILDESPGAEGHRILFFVLAGFALTGGITSLIFQRWTARLPSA